MSTQIQKPSVISENEAVEDILELYASKADELIIDAKGRDEKNIHLVRAEQIRQVRETLAKERNKRFTELAVSDMMLPVTCLVIRHPSAIDRLEKLPTGLGLEFCSAFKRALDSEKQALGGPSKTLNSKLKKEESALLDRNMSRLKEMQAKIAGRKPL